MLYLSGTLRVEKEESQSLLPTMAPSTTQMDKGYAWVVCASCFFIYAICDGVGMSFGVLVPYIMKNMGASHAKAAFVGSLHIGTSYMTAPINTTLAKMVGYRKMSLIGSIVVTLALAACSFCYSVVNTFLGTIFTLSKF